MLRKQRKTLGDYFFAATFTALHNPYHNHQCSSFELKSGTSVTLAPRMFSPILVFYSCLFLHHWMDG